MIGDIVKKSKKLPKIGSNLAKTAIVSTAGRLMSPGKSPDEAYLDLFDDVQQTRVYEDGKKFVDLVPRKKPHELRREYANQRRKPGFKIKDFVENYFYEFKPGGETTYRPGADTTAREHVTNLWSELKRRNRKNRGSLFPLPYEYIVPGGRFSEQFYWDTYFIMLGLAADGKWKMINGMVKNYAYMIRKFGFIPTANRNYFLSRSQPPFFVHMVQLLSQKNGKLRTYAEYLPSMLAEYRFWMKGRKLVKDNVDNRAYARVVQMPNGALLNRFFDNKITPRPEMQMDDLEIAELSASRDKDKIFLDLRSAAESGWDFSSRWFREPQDLQSIHTTDLVAVDLNCLLYQLEQTIAEAYKLIKQPLLAKRFSTMAERRAETVRQFCWDEKEEFFCDYDFRMGKPSGSTTLAGVFPLYANLASKEQAAAVANRLEEDFLQPGGLLTTLVDNGQQWDAPNGWAPLQWVAVQGLRNYGYHKLANKVRDNWLKSCENVYKNEQRMVEKYDVTKPGALGGGGEYKLQDGFGWTNGVYAAFKDEQMADIKKNRNQA